LSVSLFEKVHIAQALTDTQPLSGQSIAHNQLNLFDL